MDPVLDHLLLAHQGGWDEAAVLLGPVIVFLVIRYLGRNAEDAATGGTEDEPEGGGADESATGDHEDGRDGAG